MQVKCTYVVVLAVALSLFHAEFVDAGFAQDTPASASVKLPSTESLPPDFPVLTLHGVCPSRARTSGQQKTCETVVTRAEFEKLAHALDPAMTKFERRQLADTYANTLALSHEAARRGLDKDPRVLEKLRYNRLRVLAGEMANEIYSDAMRTSDSDAIRYYNENKESFRRYTVQRVFIPTEKQGDLAGKDGDSGAAEMKALAERIRARAAAGEDFEHLQKEVMTASGIKGDVDVTMKEISRRGLPDNHQQVFELKTNSVSPLIPDENGYYVYRVVSSGIAPLPEVRQLVLADIESSKQTRAFQKITDAAKPDINESYFEKYEPPPAKEAESAIEND